MGVTGRVTERDGATKHAHSWLLNHHLGWSSMNSFGRAGRSRVTPKRSKFAVVIPNGRSRPPAHWGGAVVSI